MKIYGKKVLALCVSLMLLLAIVSGCGGGGGQTEGNGGGGDADAVKPIEFKWAHHNATTSYGHTYGHEPVSKAIEEAGNGKIKITMYPAQTLTKSSENYDAVISGIADIGWSYFSYFTNRFPLSEVVNLPMLGFNTAAEASETIWRLYDETDLIKHEWAETHVLSLMSHDCAGFSANFVVKTKEDLKGRKFRTPSGPVLEFYERLGASIVSMPIPDTYQALEKGVIDGLSLVWEGQDNVSIQEVVKYGYDIKTAAGGFYLVMNKQKWESLPDDVKEVFNQECGLKAALQFSKGWDETNPMTIEKFKAAGVQFLEIDQAELDTWKEIAMEVNEKWAKDLDAKGMKGTETLNKTLEILKEIQSRQK